MNGKTAKLIRKAASVSRVPIKTWKRQYNRTPRNKRHAVKLLIQDETT